MISPSRNSGPVAINQFNAWMKQQPFYQEFLQRNRINPNRVQLSRGQQADLERLLRVNGVPIGEGVHIDNAANLNEKNRLGRNVAIGAGIAAGGYFAAPAIAGMVAGGGAAAGGGAGTIAGISGAGGTAAGVGAGAAVSAGFGLSDILMASLSPAIGTVAGIYQSRAVTNAGREASDAQTSSANYAADLQSKAAEEQLAYLREQEAQRRKEFEATEARNFGIYTEERDYDRGLYDQRQARLKPYRQFGEGSIRQLGRPMTNIRQAGTIGSMRGR